MAQAHEKLEQQINKLNDQLARKKAQLNLKAQAAKRKQADRDRRERAAHIYKLGGMVEKMGLAELDEDLFLGLLLFLRDNTAEVLASTDKQAKLSLLRGRGMQYKPVGKRLSQLIAPPANRPNLLDPAPAINRVQA